MISIKTYFEKKGWHFTQPPHSPNTYLLGFGLDNGRFQTILDLYDNDHSITCYSIYGENAPKDKFNDVLFLINMINNNIFFGNLEINIENGEIRCKTTLSLKNIELTEEVLDDIVIPNVVTMNRFIPAIKAILYDDLNPKEAYELRKSF